MKMYFFVHNKYVGSQLSWESTCLTSRGSQVRALQVPFKKNQLLAYWLKLILNMKIEYADVAQLAEQLTCNQQVIGSSPIIGFNIWHIICCKYGWVPKRPKGADCKSVSDAFEGSNPSPSIRLRPFTLVPRGGAVWKLVGLITRRSQVQILPPLLKSTQKKLIHIASITSR